MTRLFPCLGASVLSPTAPIATFRCSPSALSCTCAADALKFVRLAIFDAIGTGDTFDLSHPACGWWVRRELDGVDLSASRRGEGAMRRMYRTRAREVREAKRCA